jgi:predicted nucleic acid-binding protein
LVVVDTSVWIDLVRGRRSAAVAAYEALLADGPPVGLTDVIYMEILQGTATEAEQRELEGNLLAFPILRLARLSDYKLAAELHRAARRAGVTLRSKLDFLIAAACIGAGAPILHSDSDFDRLASCTELRVFA